MQSYHPLWNHDFIVNQENITKSILIMCIIFSIMWRFSIVGFFGVARGKELGVVIYLQVKAAHSSLAVVI